MSLISLAKLRFFCLALVLAGAPLRMTSAADSPQAADPQPGAGQMQPGLAVDYYYHKFRNVDELVDWMDYKDGKKGPPIKKLDYRVGQGRVLTSNESDGVGAHITGLIHLKEPGTYAFSAQSNDGFRLTIGGVLVVEDPGVHADRFSDIGQIEIGEPGWYPVTIHYFERKNTATLELYWQPPGGSPGTMPFVPAEAFAHVPQE